MTNKDQQWRNVIESVLSPQEAEIRDPLTDFQLSQWIQAVQAGCDPEQVLPGLHPYLATHPTEAARLDELLALFQADEAHELLEPLSPPGFRLDFLAPSGAIGIPAWVAEQFHSGRTWIQDQMGVIWVSFTEQLLGQSPLQPALVTRNQPEKPEPTGEENLYQLSIGSEELDDLDLEIRAVRDADPAYCTLIVTVRIPSRWPELANVAVTILRSEPLRSGQTDKEGQVKFENFPVEDLTRMGFQVKAPVEG
jgi:hypothetical protein